MSDEEDEDAEAADGKKRKKGANKDGADGKDAKRKKPEVDKRDKQRLANMFAKNAAAVAAGGLKRAPMADAAGAKPAQDADSPHRCAHSRSHPLPISFEIKRYAAVPSTMVESITSAATCGVVAKQIQFPHPCAHVDFLPCACVRARVCVRAFSGAYFPLEVTLNLK